MREKPKPIKTLNKSLSKNPLTSNSVEKCRGNKNKGKQKKIQQQTMQQDQCIVFLQYRSGHLYAILLYDPVGMDQPQKKCKCMTSRSTTNSQEHAEAIEQKWVHQINAKYFWRLPAKETNIVPQKLRKSRQFPTNQQNIHS